MRRNEMIGKIDWSPDYRTPKQRELESDLKQREWQEIFDELKAVHPELTPTQKKELLTFTKLRDEHYA